MVSLLSIAHGDDGFSHGILNGEIKNSDAQSSLYTSLSDTLTLYYSKIDPVKTAEVMGDIGLSIFISSVAVDGSKQHEWDDLRELVQTKAIWTAGGAPFFMWTENCIGAIYLGDLFWEDECRTSR